MVAPVAVDLGYADATTMSYALDEFTASGRPRLRVRSLAAYGGRNVETNTIDGLLARIDVLGHLTPNWDSYGASPPNADTLAWARRTVQLADRLSLTPTAIVPSSESGIGIIFRQGRRYGDVEFLNSGEILAVTSDGSGKPRVWEVEASDAGVAESLKVIREYLR